MKTKEFFEFQYNLRIRKTIVTKEVSHIWNSLNIIKSDRNRELNSKSLSVRPKNYIDLNLMSLLGFRRGKERLEMHDLMVVVKKANVYAKSDAIIKACDKKYKLSSAVGSLKEMDIANVKKQPSENSSKKKVGILKELPSPKSLKDKFADMRKRNNTFAIQNLKTGAQIQLPSIVDQEVSENSQAKKISSLVNINVTGPVINSPSPQKGYLVERFLANIRDVPRFKFELSEEFAKCILLAFFDISKENKIMLKYFQ